jgi:hypothetical protein
MKTEHTPGPWIGKNGSGGQGVIYSEATGANVAVSYDHRDTALIAAAPEMLAFIQAVSRTEEGGPYPAAALHAIKRDALALLSTMEASK